MKYDIKNINLANCGKKRIEWAKKDMPVLNTLIEEFKKEKPFLGVRISACLHVTTETANLVIALKEGGADVLLCASNPLSTQDDTAAALVKYYKIPVFAICGESKKVYYKHIREAILRKPNITLDDGADLVSELHRIDLSKFNIFGSTEETTTGVIRLKSLEFQGRLKFPVIAVNDAKTKHFFDNRYGTGQSTIDGITRAANLLWAGKKVVVCGYGWCGRGIAYRAGGMSSEVIVCETDPIRALEAKMDGFQVMPLSNAARIGEVFITATGNISVIRKEHFLKMQNGVIVANAGHFNVEINLDDLVSISERVRKVKDGISEYVIRTKLNHKKSIYVLAQGRLVNLACGDGHPAQVMDMSFSGQALACRFIAEHYKRLKNKVYKLPDELDKRIAYLKLKSMGIKIDSLTKKQKEYLKSWEIGT